MYTIELNRLIDSNILWDFEFNFYTDDEEIKNDFKKLFEDYFYFNEIGTETIPRFKRMFVKKFNTRMPYYRKLYATELASENIDFLLNKDYKETYTKINKGIENNSDLESSSNNSNTEANQNNKVKNTSVENGNSNNVEKHKGSHLDNGNGSVGLQDSKLTDVTENITNSDIVSNSTNNSDSISNNIISSINNSKINRENNKTHDNVEEYELIGKGNIGVTSSAELLSKWREVILNINEMILVECRDLFMLIY